VLLWDLTDPTRPRRLGEPLTGHTGPVNALAFTPDGHTLATASSDRTVLLWDLTDPTRARRLGEPLTGPTGAVTAVAFAPDGHTLATASVDQTVLLWDLSGLDALRADPMERACSLSGGALDAGEWGRSVPGLAYVDSCSQ
jgi:WD40 repeat protein